MNIVVSFSGGLDSTCLIAFLKEKGYNVVPVSFTYGSKHNKYENEAARNIAEYFQLKLIEINMEAAFSSMASNLLKTGGEIPEGHYASDNMKLTVVPGRNMIFLSVLTGIAESMGIDQIGIGVHAGDHAIYPDCRADFIQKMTHAVYSATDKKVVDIKTPFLHLTKTELLRKVYFNRMVKVPFDLTRTCYKNQPVACGKCGSCVERLEAFTNNGFIDPIEYQHR